jgi:predicted aspartyl protease
MGFETCAARLRTSLVAALLQPTMSALATAHPLKEHNHRLFIPVTINGVEAEALLDSAAEMTFVDPALAQRLGLKAQGSETAQGSGGAVRVQFADGVNVAAAGVSLANLTVALLDMRDLSKRLGENDLRIILGREFFDAARVRIDIGAGVLEKIDPAVEPRGVKLLLTSERGIESVPCRIEGVATQADIDLGNGSEVLVGRAFAQANGLLASARITGRKTGSGIGGAVDRDLVTLSRLEIAGVEFADVPAAIDPQPTAGAVNVGTSILRRFVLVIDYGGHAAWFEPK